MRPFPHRMAGHCGSGAFRDLLEFHGLSWFDEPMSEAMAFGLGGGLGCFFYELPEMTPPLYLVGRGGGLERGVCEHLGIDLDLRRTDDGDEGWRWLRDELEAGRPTMVWADIGELEYLNVRLRMTMHDIVVCGYDEAEGVALIADNDRDEIQRCSLSALARARNSQAFPGPNRHATWVMAFPSALPDAGATIETAVRGAVDNMRGGGRSLVDSDAGAPMGLDAVAAIEGAFPAWPERFGDRLPSALRGLRTFVVKAGTGGALFRSLHAGFLRDAAALLDDDGLADAATVYDELSREWVAAAEAIADRDPASAHAAAAEHVARACALERAGVEAMEARAV